MELIGAALGDQRDLGAGGAAFIGVAVGGGDAELLDRIDGHVENAGHGGAAVLVDDVGAIEGDVALVALTAVDVAALIDARLERQERGDVSRVGRQFHDLVALNGVAEGGIDGIDLGGARFDGNGFGGGADLLELHRNGGRLVHQNFDIVDSRVSESRRFGVDPIVTGLHTVKGITALCIRHGDTLKAGLLIGKCDRCVWNYGSRWIRNGPV